MFKFDIMDKIMVVLGCLLLVLLGFLISMFFRC